MSDELLNNLEVINHRIRRICEHVGRNPDEVKLLLATKTVSPERIKIALQAGQTLIAENKIQEVKEKYEALKGIPHEKHFIGHLQTNKIKDLLKYEVSCLQSLDRLDLAEKLHQRLALENRMMNVLIQVNTSQEESKFGVHPDQAVELVKQVSELETLRIKGLMTIGLFSAEAEEVRKCFKLLKGIQQQIIELNLPHVEMKELSMGMSGDMEVAIEEGSTIVRVGTAIFGQRATPDSYYWNETRSNTDNEERNEPGEGELILYQTAEGTVRIEVLYESETFWLNQKRIAKLFGVDVRTVNEHLKNIYDSGELPKEATIRKFRRVQAEGNREVRREIEYYNLDAIISVGYRVNSIQATQFRIWSTQTLREFVIKGFVLDDERLKLNKRFGKDYFDELLERIREIRASERRFYLKITDIYEQCSIDYDRSAEITQTFFKTVQNKLHWAVTGKTAAEIITERSDASKPSMGLTTWRNAPRGKILKNDVSIAKNYLIENEIKELERIVTMYLDYAENQAARQITMKMIDWVRKLDAFLQFNEYEVLTNAGSVSAEVAKRLAEERYASFRIQQDERFESDFEKEIKRIEKKGGKPKGDSE